MWASDCVRPVDECVYHLIYLYYVVCIPDCGISEIIPNEFSVCHGGGKRHLNLLVPPRHVAFCWTAAMVSDRLREKRNFAHYSRCPRLILQNPSHSANTSNSPPSAFNLPQSVSRFVNLPGSRRAVKADCRCASR